MSDMKDEDAGWLKHCFTVQLDVEALQAEIAQSKINKGLKEKLEMLIDILFCNERIIHYRTSVNYFLEKLIDPCPTCKKYSYRIEKSVPKEGNPDYCVTTFICEPCKGHKVEMIVPYKLVLAYCHFYQITPPERGQQFSDDFTR